jgi:nucleotide-binding universal stress UspA family protein
MNARSLHRRFTSVLCPIDFSEHSRLALRYAAQIAVRSGARLTVLYVNDPLLHAAAAAADYDVDAMAQHTARELTSFVRRSLSAAVCQATSVRCEEALGRPAREIVKRARRGGFNLIVLGTQGLSGASKLFFGSTTAGVLRDTDVPVLAVPPVPHGRRAGRPARSWPGPHFIVPTDLARSSPANVRQAVGLARWLGAKLLLLHVIRIPPPPPWYRADVTHEVDALADRARAALEALRADARDTVGDVSVVAGDLADEIAAAARRHRAGLVVLALRSRRRLFGSRAGSIAYSVVCRATAPVLALPPERRTRSRRS